MSELLADHTTLRLGGPADRFLTHTDPAAWPDLARSLPTARAPFVLAGGSNTLADDGGYPGTVIRMATHGIAVRPLGDDLVEVVTEAGEPLSSLVAFTVAEGLSGIEYLGGIPGTTGAAPVQNTGAYGQQISDTLTRITAYDWSLGHTTELQPGDCDFGYRTSAFKTQPGRWTILDVGLRLTRTAWALPSDTSTSPTLLRYASVPGHRSPRRPKPCSPTADTAVSPCPPPGRTPARRVRSSSIRPSPPHRQRRYVRPAAQSTAARTALCAPAQGGCWRKPDFVPAVGWAPGCTAPVAALSRSPPATTPRSLPSRRRSVFLPMPSSRRTGSGYGPSLSGRTGWRVLHPGGARPSYGVGHDRHLGSAERDRPITEPPAVAAHGR